VASSKRHRPMHPLSAKLSRQVAWVPAALERPLVLLALAREAAVAADLHRELLACPAVCPAAFPAARHLVPVVLPDLALTVAPCSPPTELEA